jgi:Bacterial Ig-like domain/L,D-transpeptidase catalytic domain
VTEAGQPEDQPDGDGPEDGDNSAGGTRQATATKPKANRRSVVIGAVIAAVVLGGAIYAVARPGQSSGPSPAALAAAAAAKGPLTVESVTPASRTTGVNGSAPIVVTFSVPLAASSPHPQLTPAVAGTWSTQGNMMVFTPEQAYGPSEHVMLEVPGGPAGVRSAHGRLLGTTVTDQFTTGDYSQAALAQLLAQLGYLPVTWSPLQNGATRAAQTLTGYDAASQTPQGQAFDPPAGTFEWAAGYPSILAQMWSPDQANVLLRGAVMAFEAQHNMTIDGSLTPRLWQALFQAQARGDRNQVGYTYAIANKGSPETLTIWHDGRVVLRSLANTGIGVAPTVDGTFPVYLRFLNTIMSGTNPDGSHYSDPVSFVSYFNGGDAVHYFPRGGYGYQQSLGCVELPYTAAQQAYPYLTYGSLVTVTG